MHHFKAHCSSKKNYFSFLSCSSPQSCGFLVCWYSSSWCHGFHSVCTDILERIKNKGRRSFLRTFPPGRNLCRPGRPVGYDSVMNDHTAIASPAHLVRSCCDTATYILKKKIANMLFPLSQEEQSVMAPSAFAPSLRCKPSLATINPTRNGFSDNAGKQVLHKTAVFSCNRKLLCRPLASVRTADPLWFYFFAFLSFLSPTFPLILRHRCQAACKAGNKNIACSAFSLFKGQCSGLCSSVGGPGYILFATAGSPRQSGRDSAKQSSASIKAGQLLQPAVKQMLKFST